jgi:hypothetical protein
LEIPAKGKKAENNQTNSIISPEINSSINEEKQKYNQLINNIFKNIVHIVKKISQI